MKYTGLHISDDALYCLDYTTNIRGHFISKFGCLDIPQGIVEGGEIKDEKKFSELLKQFDHDHDLSFVKVSVPEEKAYLFQTDVPSANVRAIAQNIESKLEESVPLSAPDAVFYFDLLPKAVTGGALRASVSVVARSYIEKVMGLLRNSGIFPVAFEVLPKSIAMAVIEPKTPGAEMIVHIMNRKTGIYIVSESVVCFTSTISWGSQVSNGVQSDISILIKEINRIHEYWTTHNPATSALNRIILVGKGSLVHENVLKTAMSEFGIEVGIADVWRNTFDLDNYIPPISREDSLDYAVAAGLAIS
ncbi:MAG: hypothetical protein WC648_03150 [Candidatus Paceibacterota bacterium]|jgi:Tfp pilus assembly PilM family ATPase